MMIGMAAPLGCAPRADRGLPPSGPSPGATSTAVDSTLLAQDLRHALAELQRMHPEFDHAHPHARFESEIAGISGRDLDRSEAFLIAMRLVALIEDAHTRLADWRPISDPRLPIGVEAWSDGYWITSVHRGAEPLFGARIVGIGGCPIDEAVQALRPLVPHDNDATLRHGAAHLLSHPLALAHVGLASGSDGALLDLEMPDGSRRVERIASIPAESAGPAFFIAPIGWEAPLWRRRPHDPWWWCELDSGRILYLAYNRCIRSRTAPFDLVVREILDRFDSGGVHRIVIDLRSNAGGDSRVIDPLIRGLAQRGIRGERVVVAIGPRTISSGMLAAFELSRRLDATLIGEPTGQKPDSFGELRSFELPNTGWRIQCSTKRFVLFGDDRPSLDPAVRIEQRFTDLMAGRDPVLEWAIQPTIEN